MDVPIWPGSSSFSPGRSSFGYYDNDYRFQVDADKVALWCSRRLGFPMMDVELQDVDFYSAFEEAVTIYGSELYSFQIRDNIINIEGLSTGSNLNNALIYPNLSVAISVAEQYGSEVGVGNVEWRTGFLDMTASLQSYDLEAWAISNGISGSNIEIKKIFFGGAPSGFYDPYAANGGYNLGGAFGFNGSPASTFLLLPVNYNIALMQSIEFNQMIRRSNYSFELTNNKLKLFPVPSFDEKLYFEYALKSDRINNSVVQQPGNVTNVSNAPYGTPVYSQINSVALKWIYDYTLAICKEMLGYVRGKYSEVPIPNENVTLNHDALISASKEEKAALLERLRAYFDETSRKSSLERKSQENEFIQKDISMIPLQIYSR